MNIFLAFLAGVAVSVVFAYWRRCVLARSVLAVACPVAEVEEGEPTFAFDAPEEEPTNPRRARIVGNESPGRLDETFAEMGLSSIAGFDHDARPSLVYVSASVTAAAKQGWALGVDDMRAAFVASSEFPTGVAAEISALAIEELMRDAQAPIAPGV